MIFRGGPVKKTPYRLFWESHHGHSSCFALKRPGFVFFCQPLKGPGFAFFSTIKRAEAGRLDSWPASW